LRALQIEILHQSKRLRICNVYSIEESEEVEDAEEWNYSHVDFGHELLLGGVRRADDMKIIVFDACAILRYVGIVVIVDLVFGTWLWVDV
jgi:hypothetical protein